MAPHNCYKAQGNEHMWLTIVVGSEEERRALCCAIGQPALADPRFNSAAMRKRNEANSIASSRTARRRAIDGRLRRVNYFCRRQI
jgi:crotonobetainyl-CoA:carnitine CoA-transferase CaiB-like acyl-CoA transferase